MFCWCCHDTTHDFIFFTMAGGSPAEFRAIVSLGGHPKAAISGHLKTGHSG